MAQISVWLMAATVSYSVIILKTSAIIEKWVRKTQEESQRCRRLSLVLSDQIRAAPEFSPPCYLKPWLGAVLPWGVWRGGAWTRIRGIPDESMFLWMSADTFYTSPRNGTTDGHKIYTANILMFYSPVWETFFCKKWGNAGANFEPRGKKKETMA